MIPKVEWALMNLELWIEERLSNLEYRDTSSVRKLARNGFAFSAIPDWELRQKLDIIKEAKASLKNGIV